MWEGELCCWKPLILTRQWSASCVKSLSRVSFTFLNVSEHIQETSSYCCIFRDIKSQRGMQGKKRLNRIWNHSKTKQGVCGKSGGLVIHMQSTSLYSSLSKFSLQWWSDKRVRMRVPVCLVLFTQVAKHYVLIFFCIYFICLTFMLFLLWSSLKV